MVIADRLKCLSAGKVHTDVGNSINFCLLHARRVSSLHLHWKIGRVLFAALPLKGCMAYERRQWSVGEIYRVQNHQLL